MVIQKPTYVWHCWPLGNCLLCMRKLGCTGAYCFCDALQSTTPLTHLVLDLLLRLGHAPRFNAEARRRALLAAQPRAAVPTGQLAAAACVAGQPVRWERAQRSLWRWPNAVFKDAGLKAPAVIILLQYSTFRVALLQIKASSPSAALVSCCPSASHVTCRTARRTAPHRLPCARSATRTARRTARTARHRAAGSGGARSRSSRAAGSRRTAAPHGRPHRTRAHTPAPCRSAGRSAGGCQRSGERRWGRRGEPGGGTRREPSRLVQQIRPEGHPVLHR